MNVNIGFHLNTKSFMKFYLCMHDLFQESYKCMHFFKRILMCLSWHIISLWVKNHRKNLLWYWIHLFYKWCDSEENKFRKHKEFLLKKQSSWPVSIYFTVHRWRLLRCSEVVFENISTFYVLSLQYSQYDIAMHRGFSLMKWEVLEK